MQKLADTFNSYSKRNLTSIAIDHLTIKEEDNIIDHYSDLIDTNYRAWFIKRLRAIGKSKFIQRGDTARRHGKDKQRYFTSLVKE